MEFAVYFSILIGWSGIPFTRGRTTLLIAPALITALLFFSALVNQLALGVSVVKVAGLGSAAYTIALAFRSAEVRKHLLQTGLAFLLVFLLSYFLSHGRNYWVWDEFSHWGAQVEYLLSVGDLDRRGDILLFPDYIPGLSLWRYFARVVLVDFGVAAAYFSGWIIVFSCLIVALGPQKKARFVSAFLVCGFIFASFFQSLPLSLLADPVQAVLLMCGLVLARDARNSALALVPVVILLILSKHVGLIFCFFIFLYYFSRQYFIHQRPAGPVIRDLIPPFSVVTLFFLAWRYFVEHYNLSTSEIVYKKIASLNLHETLTYLFDTFLGMIANKFPHASFNESLIQFENKINIGFGGAVVCSMLISFLFITITNRTRPEKIVDICFVSIFVAFYILFLTCIRATTPWGGDAYSFSRYISVVLFSVTTFLTPEFLRKTSLFQLMLLASIATLSALVLAPKPGYFFSIHPHPPIEINDSFERKAKEALSHIDATDRLWYIFPENGDFNHYIFKMKLIPFYVEPHQSGLNIFYNTKGSDWPDRSHRLSEFSKRMCAVDFLYIDDASDFFWEDYGELFDKPKSGKLYRVEKNTANRCLAALVKD